MRCLVLTALSLGLTACAAAPEQRSLDESSGAELYSRLCASCHGTQGRGDGPVAPLIAAGVPDLTTLAVRRGGVFPADEVRRTIDGRWDRRAHGARDMPVWGWTLYDESGGDEASARARSDELIDRLVRHLASMQR